MACCTTPDIAKGLALGLAPNANLEIAKHAIFNKLLMSVMPASDRLTSK